MPSFPSITLPAANVKFAFRELVTSEALNLRMMAFPRGVYRGWEPSVTPGSLIVTFGVDEELGISNLKVGAITKKVQIDIFSKDPIALDFTDHTSYPVYVIARADYDERSATQARIFTRSSGPIGPQEVALCLVDRPGDDLTVDTTVPGRRNPPIAFQGQAFGYMREGASDDITFAQSATTEVTTARDDIKNPGPPPGGQLLADRLAIDLAADFLADQLGLRQTTMAGNAKSVSSGAGTANFSGSFARQHREIGPPIDVPPGGSESSEGAVHDPDDRAIVLPVNDTTGERLIDSARHPIYGKLEFSSGALTGTLDFVQASTTVFGTGTNFTGELEVGDIILGDDGDYYEVHNIVNAAELDLSLAYQGATASGISSSFRRWTVRFFTRASGSEVAVNISDTTTVRIFFSAFWRTDRSIFDATALMKRTGERPALPVATDTVRGRILAAINGGEAAAIHTISAAGAPITGGPNFHTLNFTGENASIANAGGGVANIVVPGDTGPVGPGATPGPTGPDGSPGPGANTLNAFELSGTFGPGGSHTHTVDFSGATPPLPTTLIHVVGGLARFGATDWGNVQNQWEIVFINKTGTVASMGIDLDEVTTSSAVTKGYLGASI